MSKNKRIDFKAISKVFSLVLAFIMLVGSVPLSVLADTLKEDNENLSLEQSKKQLTVNFMGEEIERPADGIFYAEIDGFNEPVEVKLSEYIYIDGERISIGNQKIKNIVPVIPASGKLARSVTPNVSEIVHVAAAYTPNADVSMTF